MAQMPRRQTLWRTLASIVSEEYVNHLRQVGGLGYGCYFRKIILQAIDRIFGSGRDVMKPTILAGFVFLPDRHPVRRRRAVCGFQAPGNRRPSGWELPRFSSGASFHRETPKILATLVEIGRRSLSEHRKRRFSETRVNCGGGLEF
jgi:hypothetical protein